MRTRLGRAVRVGCMNYFKGVVVFVGAMVLLCLCFGLGVGFFDGDHSFSFNGFGIASVMFVLVLGVAGLRENLRLFMQNGVSRRSAFLAELITLAAVALALAVFGQALTAAIQMLFRDSGSVFAAGMYQMLYVGFAPGTVMTPGQMAAGGALELAMMLALGLLGEFFSAMFWRLNKFWTVTAAISIPVLLNAIPWGLYWLADRVPPLMEALAAVARWLLDSSWNLTAAFALAAAALAGLNWLLLRRAYIKGLK